MKLVILSQYFYPETGAPQNRLLELSNGFKDKGWDISVVTAMPNYPKGKIYNEYKGKFSKREELQGIKIIRYWLYASNSAKSIPRIISMLSFSIASLFSFGFIKKFKPDFIFTESPPLTLALSGYLLSKFTGSKLIMNVSDVWPLSAKELGVINDGSLYKILERFEKFLYRKSFLCSGQSEEIVSHIKQNGGERVYLFRNGVDVKRFESKESIFKNSDIINIVYAGLLGVAQGIYDLARNIDFRKLGAELHIYGEGAEKEKLENYLKENQNRNIFLHNSVSREEIPEVLSEYYCTIIPLVNNIYGAVPSKIYEAMAAGLPVLFSGSGEGAKIIHENKVGLVSGPKDYKALTDNILEIKNSVNLRNEMSLRGRKLASERFDRNILIEKFSKKLLSYLDK